MTQIHTVVRYAPAAANYSSNIGEIVYESAIVSSKPRATLATTATSVTNRPLGVIKDAADENGGKLSIVCFGPYQVRVGAAITPGTDNLLMPDANSKAIPATDGHYYLGFPLQEHVAAADDLIDIFISPGYLETT